MVGSYGWFADQHSIQLQKGDDQRGDVIGKRLACRDLAISGVEMGKDHTLGKAGADGPQSFAHVAEQEKFGRRNTIGVGCDGPLADIDIAMREELPKMIVGPAVAEAEFQHFTILIANQIGSQFEASALRLQPTNEAVQPTQRNYAATPVVSRNFFNSARAARS